MSTSPVLPNLEYLKYIEPHLATKLVEFILKDNPNEELKSLYKALSIKTKNFDKISSEKFMSESVRLPSYIPVIMVQMSLHPISLSPQIILRKKSVKEFTQIPWLI